MPRYYFDVFHGDDHYEDQEGEELPNHSAAWEMATKTAGDSLKDLDGRLQPGRPWRLEVYDEFRAPLYALEIKAMKAA